MAIKQGETMNMANVLTETGLHLPENASEADLIEVGIELTHREEHAQHDLMLIQWQRGEWWNALPDGRKAEICEASGTNPRTAKRCGWVVEWAKSINVAVGAIQSFYHLRSLTHQQLTSDQAKDLLEKSATFGWTAGRLKRERDLVLNIHPMVTKDTKPKHFEQAMDEIIDDLPQRTSEKTKKEIRKFLTKLENDFWEEVHQESKKQVDIINEKRRRSLDERERKLDAMQKRLHKAYRGFHQVISDEEYKIIRGCLHPDRVPADRRDKFDKAFKIFEQAWDEIDLSPGIDFFKEA